MLRRALIGGLALLLLALLPEVASACPVCFDPREENRMAFLATTVFLSLLPLGMVAGAGVWMRRRVRELDGHGDHADPGDHGARESDGRGG